MTIRQQRVTFEARGETVVGTLFGPADGASERRAALVVDGPLTSVKEQAQGHHARALAERGYFALAFDHRFFGESGGQPRQFEAPREKIADIGAAIDFLSGLPEIDPNRIGAVGVCAGAGYMAGAVAEDRRIRAFGTVAGFFHDANKQREWMGDSAFESTIEAARAARKAWEESGQAELIPAVGKQGPVAMPMAEAFEYYGTPRGAVENYTNAFAVMSREQTLPYDAQTSAPRIGVPTLIVHSEKALAPALARSFYDALAGEKAIHWLPSKGQIDFYDDPECIEPAADLLADHFRRHL